MTQCAYYVLGMVLSLLIGFMLGVLFRASTGAIVAYFVLTFCCPTVSGLLAESQQWFHDLQPWVDIQFAQADCSSSTTPYRPGVGPHRRHRHHLAAHPHARRAPPRDAGRGQVAAAPPQRARSPNVPDHPRSATTTGPAMDITPTKLTRSAGLAAVAAGAIFIAVQLNHPPLTVAGVHPAEWAIRSSLKMLMAALALVGITGMYLYQVRKMGVLGLIGFVLFAANYLFILSTSFVAAIVLPAIADTSPSLRHQRPGRSLRSPPARLHRRALQRHPARRLSVPGRQPDLRHRAVPSTGPAALGSRAPGHRRPRDRGALADARPLVPAAGRPQRHRHDRPGLLPVAHRRRPAHRDHRRHQ